MISLITTVFNEEKNLNRWLDSILNQSFLPDEIIIVDGGSSDNTWGMLQKRSAENNLIKVSQIKGNISCGRNEAIRLANGDIIVVTDAGCIYDKDWFKKIVEPFLNSVCQVTATGFGPWLETEDQLLQYLIASATTPSKKEFYLDWLPSSRSVAFRREVWVETGGYPEWIPICEDVVFDLKIKKLDIKINYVRELLVFWRPRATLQSYFKQLFRYTKSDGHGKLWLGRQLIRYGVYLGSLVLLILIFMGDVWPIIVLILGLVVYIKKFWLRFFEYAKSKSLIFKMIGFILVPFIVAFGDVAKMCGWPVGVYERRSGKIKFEQY